MANCEQCGWEVQPATYCASCNGFNIPDLDAPPAPTYTLTRAEVEAMLVDATAEAISFGMRFQATPTLSQSDVQTFKAESIARILAALDAKGAGRG